MNENLANPAFGGKQREIMDLLISLGMPKNTSKIILFLSRNRESTSQIMEDSLDLKQSEVSVNLKWLRGRGWLKSRSMKSKGKGRPTQTHTLSYPLKRIVKDIESDKMHEMEDLKKNLNKLKRLAK